MTALIRFNGVGRGVTWLHLPEMSRSWEFVSLFLVSPFEGGSHIFEEWCVASYFMTRDLSQDKLMSYVDRNM